MRAVLALLVLGALLPGAGPASAHEAVVPEVAPQVDGWCGGHGPLDNIICLLIDWLPESGSYPGGRRP